MDLNDRVYIVAEGASGLDGALICIGGSPGGRVSDVTDERWMTAFESGFLGTLRLCRHSVTPCPVVALWPS